MASELSRLIEDELRHKGYYVGGEEDVEEEPDPNQALMGALRVEVRAFSFNEQMQNSSIRSQLSSRIYGFRSLVVLPHFLPLSFLHSHLSLWVISFCVLGPWYP